MTAAVELSDRRRELIDESARRRASRESRRAGEDASEGGWIVERARKLLDQGLLHEAPIIRRWLQWIRPRRSNLLVACMASFVLGLASNALGDSRSINVLSLPLLLTIVWNLWVIAWSLFSSWIPVSPGSLPRRVVEGFPKLVDRWLERAPQASFGGEGAAGVWRRAIAKFMSSWSPSVAPLAVARLRRLFHAAAIAFAFGLIGGMYLRGIVFSYRASWESTFLGAATIERFFEIFLGPASRLLATPIPALEAIRSPASGDAAPWIHLFALTAVVYVALPRLILVAVEHVRVRRFRRAVSIPLPLGYWRRLLATSDPGHRSRMEIIPYSYSLGTREQEMLKTLLLDLFGGQVDVDVAAMVTYGMQTNESGRGEGKEMGPAVIVFGLGQTPESEVHGEWLIEASREREILVVVDASKYRKKTGSEARVKERRRTWDRVVAGAGLKVAHLDLSAPRSGPEADEFLDRLDEARRSSEAIE